MSSSTWLICCCICVEQVPVPGSAQQASREPTSGKGPSRDVSHGRGPRPDPSQAPRRHPHGPPAQPNPAYPHHTHIIPTSKPSSSDVGMGEIRPVGSDAAEPSSGLPGTRTSSRSHSRGRSSSQANTLNIPESEARVVANRVSGAREKRLEPGTSRQDSRQRSRLPSAPRTQRGS